MPHDCNGLPLKIGDIVKGKTHGVSYPIVGPVLAISPGAQTCNIQVGYASAYRSQGVTTADGSPDQSTRPVVAYLGTAWADAAQLELVERCPV